MGRHPAGTPLAEGIVGGQEVIVGAADAGAEHGAAVAQRHHGFKVVIEQPGVEQGLAGRFRCQAREARRVADHFASQEAAGYLRIVNVAPDQAGKLVGIEVADPGDAGFPGQHSAPRFVHRWPERGDGAEAGDDDAVAWQ
jgi:hypothetical protein